MESLSVEKKIQILESYLTPERKQRIHRVLSHRTRFLNVILENIYQPHNASAVLRSCEAFGVQDIHIIEQTNSFAPIDTVAMGSSKWLSIHHYKDTVKTVYDTLRTQGYTIYATCPHENARSIDTLELHNNKKISIAFGNELNGLSQEAIDYADEILYLPMYGFVESFNISVSVAITLSNLIRRMKQENIDTNLSQEEKHNILLEWLLVDVHKADEILKKHQ